MTERLTIREAAARLGVSIDTIRRRISRGELASHREEHGKGSIIYVELPDDVAEAAQGTPTAPAEVDVLRDYVQELKRQLEVREREVLELHTLLAQAQHVLPEPTAQPDAEPTAEPNAVPIQPPEIVNPEHQQGLWTRLRQWVGM